MFRPAVGQCVMAATFAFGCVASISKLNAIGLECNRWTLSKRRQLSQYEGSRSMNTQESAGIDSVLRDLLHGVATGMIQQPMIISLQRPGQGKKRNEWVTKRHGGFRHTDYFRL